MKLLYLAVLLAFCVTSACAQRDVGDTANTDVKRESLAKGVSLFQMGHDRMMSRDGECSVGFITQLGPGGDFDGLFISINEVPSSHIWNYRVRVYRVINVSDMPPVYYISAVGQDGCVYFLNGFEKNSWTELVKKEVGTIKSDSEALDLAKLYLQTVEAENFWGNVVINTSDDIKRCKSQSPEGSVLPVILHGADGALRVIVHSCDPATGIFWRHQFSFRTSGETELESTKI